jgi:predicted N-formylglutamate amidohydrolase
MPGSKPALADVGGPEHRDRRTLTFRPRQFVISVEHASNRIPAPYNNLGLTRRQLDSHIAWDPGAKAIARACAKALGRACHEGRYSRLLVDLNRGPRHPKLMARTSFSVSVPGNQKITPEEKQRRIERYYEPYRERVGRDIQRVIAAAGPCIHLSIHSFTPVVDGVVRSGDIGILFDPRSPLETALARELVSRLKQQGFHVRRNYPYRGVSDGLVTHFRRSFAAGRYAGLEIEVNQALLRTPGQIRAVARRISQTIRSLAQQRRSRPPAKAHDRLRS